MKKANFLNMALLVLLTSDIQAQVSLQNNGTLYVSNSSAILFVNGTFTNASGAAFTNNGSLYVKQNLINDQAGMAVGTGTLYLNGSAGQTLSGAQLFSTFNLVTNNASGITLNTDLRVNGLHTFSAGVITTSATPNYLLYEAGASYTGDGDTKHVNGWVRKTGATAFIFPLGNGVVERTVATTGLSGATVFNALYAGATTNTGNLATPLITVDPYEYWTVNKVSGGTAAIIMNWNNAKVTMPPYALADIRVANYITGNWTQVGGTATGNVTSTGTITSNSLSSFGAFTFGSISFALPVNLVQFSAYKNNGYGVVNWSTSDEINVDHYEIQRSDDGVVYYTAGMIAARNIASLQQYEFSDGKRLNDITYYRLRSVDADGKSKLSKVVKVTDNNGTGVFMAASNPVRNSVRITIKNLSGVFEYRINTISGQTIQRGTIKMPAAGMYDIYLSSAVKTGIYLLEIQKTGFRFTEKLLVQ
ncbi:MAG: T9SS type A sorting domain-containing protein [Chitinophagaceae bacterium]